MARHVALRGGSIAWAALLLAGCGGGGGGSEPTQSPASGQVDSSYASAGRYSFTMPGYGAGPASTRRIAVSGDGTVYIAGPTVRKLDAGGNLVAGYRGDLASHSPALDDAGNLYVRTAAGIAKLDPGGSLVASFGVNGEALAPAMASGTGTFARDASGNLFLAGYAADSSAIAISKYDGDGRLVATFGIAGTHLLEVPRFPRQNSVDAVAVDARGNVFVGGHGFDSASPARAAFVAKLDADGRIATDFGDAGFWYAPPICSSRAPQAIAFDALGYAYVGCEPAIFKMDNRGDLDATFGLLGASTPLPGGMVTSLLVATNGEIFVAGERTTAPAPCSDFVLARLDARGGPVPGFGTDGRVAIDVANRDERANVAMDGAGRLYVSGVSIAPCTIERPVAESIASVTRLR